MSDIRPPRRPALLSARARLTLTYAAFTVVAGALALAVIYVIIRKFPNYPLTSAQFPNAPDVVAPTRQEILEALITFSAIALGVMAVVGLVGGWLVAGRVLKPLQALNEAARAAAAGDLQHRINMAGRADEFRQLADTFDDMLARLQQSFLSQKRFAANASHELRTPLATTKMLVEVAQADPAGRDIDRTLARVHETNERGIAIVEALLQLNSLDRRTVDQASFDLADVAAAVIATTSAEAALGGVTVSASLGPAHVEGNEVLLSQLVSNLVLNAIRHNVQGGSVTVTTRLSDAGPAIEVRNTGHVLDQTEVDQFLEPFTRHSARLAAHKGRPSGNGLGLALASRIADVHNGSLILIADPAGGLSATFTQLSR